LLSSKLIGELKNELKEAIIEGRINNNYNDCLMYLKNKLQIF
jgi:hypothetical protein